MPKKAPRNAFYYYMLNFKKEQQEKGIHYANMAEIAEAAGPSWREVPPSVRSKYEAMAKQAKQKNGLPITKYTSTGIPLSQIKLQEREMREAEENELKDIKNIVTYSHMNGTLLSEVFYVLDVNYYCKVSDSYYLIGECSMLRFSLAGGIEETYHKIINPGFIPIGYANDVKMGCMENGLEMPDECKPRSDYLEIQAHLLDYLQKGNPTKVVRPIFTMPDKVLPIRDFFRQLCSKSSEDDSVYRIYRLDTLFYNLINSIKTRTDEGFPKESLALVQLQRDLFKYTSGLGCEYHKETEKEVECSSYRIKCWSFTVLDACCAVAGIDIVPGKHVPHGYDIEGIYALREQRRGRVPPSVAGFAEPSSSNTSTVNESLLDSTTSSFSEVGGRKKEKRVHVPLRMPKTDYSHMIRAAPALTESNFPSLISGHGRGRGSLSSSMNKLKFDN
ncbi:PREDICTED: protein maelstrom homolog [Papilio xuthus]|uniref:Protein maelstrom homolog n=1 Tax=Papilio xuthus TaxID=66420 RepID=A0AAJ6YZY3_PAPXU|nr:PREDICTED: protein maelstrom homolog [Papilio xuthus]XP_013162301.1 PREDICTED: protein maelstrom homolog [Papilio xuthus]